MRLGTNRDAAGAVETLANMHRSPRAGADQASLLARISPTADAAQADLPPRLLHQLVGPVPTPCSVSGERLSRVPPLTLLLSADSKMFPTQGLVISVY